MSTEPKHKKNHKFVENYKGECAVCAQEQEPNLERIIEITIQEYNSKLNPDFSVADVEHIKKICKEVFEQYNYEYSMDRNL